MSCGRAAAWRPQKGALSSLSVCARAGIFHLPIRNDRAGAEHILAGSLRFAVKIEEGAEAFGFLGTHVLERRFGADGAGDHAHHVELAGERVRNGLEDETASRAFVAGGAFVAVGVEEGRTFERRGEEAGDGVEQFAPALFSSEEPTTTGTRLALSTPLRRPEARSSSEREPSSRYFSISSSSDSAMFSTVVSCRSAASSAMASGMRLRSRRRFRRT